MVVADVSLAFNAVGRDRGVNALLTRTSQNVRASSALATAGTWALRGALASAAASALALANSALIAGGAAAAIPAGFVAGQAVLGAFKANTFGLADAWKATGQQATAGAGKAGSAAQKSATAARQVRDATEALAAAKRDEADAAAAVNRARDDEIERLQDLNRELKSSKDDVADATAAVAKAEQDLAVARAGGSNYDIGEAERALNRAQDTLADTKDRYEDLSKEQADSAKKGVEGSDQVQEALRRQQDAHRQTQRAVEQLADAQQRLQTASAAAASGGIDPAAQALAKLSPAGRDVILTLRDLVPAWQGAARAGQQATFTGVSGDLRRLSTAYLPMATSWLARMGGAFNLVIRQSLGLATSRDTIRDVGVFTRQTATATDRLAAAVRPVLHGIEQWVAVGGSFLPEFAGDAGKLATIFDTWSTRMRESGRAAAWIRNGVDNLTKFVAIGTNVAATVLAIVHAGGDGGSTLNFLVRGSAAIRAWVESAKGQQKIGQFFAVLRGALSQLGPLFGSVAGHGDEFGKSVQILGTSAEFAVDHLGPLLKFLPTLAGAYLLLKHTGIASGVSLGVKAFQIGSQLAMARAIKAHTGALRENTVASGANTLTTEAGTTAENVGLLAKGRAAVALVAQKAALVATTVASKAAAAGQWLLNVAMDANPIALVIIAIVALVAGFVLLWNKSAAFRNFWIGLWGGIKSAASTVGSWFKNTLWGSWIKGAWEAITNKGVSVFNWFKSLPGKLKSALANVGNFILAPYKWAFNRIAGVWNGTVGRLSFTVPSWVPGLGGRGFSMPHIPQLAKGGILPAVRGGMPFIGGEGGEREVVAPLSEVPKLLGAAGAGPSGSVRVWLDMDGAGDELRRLIRRWIRVDNLLQAG